MQESRDDQQQQLPRAPGAARHHQVCVLSGTGLGPEMVAYSHATLAAVGQLHGFVVALDHQPFAAEALHRHGRQLPARTVAHCRRADAVLVADVGSALPELLVALGAAAPSGLYLGPGGHWLAEPDEEAQAHLFTAQTPVVALIAVEEGHTAGFGLADPRPALLACCLLLEAVGERAAATTLARAVHHGSPGRPSSARGRYEEPWGQAKSAQERVESVISALEERRVDVEFPGVWEATSA